MITGTRFNYDARHTTAASRILTHDQIRNSAPSVFAENPWNKMSDRYRFVPTIEVVRMMEDQGYRPMVAIQGRSRIEGKANFTKHMVRFRHDQHLGQLAVGSEFPELILTNSHDGTSAYKFSAGIFRLVCLNGLCVDSEKINDVSLKHSGSNDRDFSQRVIDVTYEIMDETPRVMQQIATWKGIETTPQERRIFAEAAAELRDTGEFKPDADRLLATRRQVDRDAATWTVANVIQENLIRGGTRGVNMTTGRRSNTREVKGVSENLRINKAVWKLTEAFAQLKGA